MSPSGARLEVVLVYGACGRGGAVGGDRLCAERVVMIFPSNRVRIMVATKPVDFRKGHDGLVAYVQSALRPFTGTVFVFRAKRRLKLVYWDGTGLQAPRGAGLCVAIRGDDAEPCAVRGLVRGPGLAACAGAVGLGTGGMTQSVDRWPPRHCATKGPCWPLQRSTSEH